MFCDMSTPQIQRCDLEVLQHLYTSPNNSFGVFTTIKWWNHVITVRYSWAIRASSPPPPKPYPSSFTRRHCGSTNLVLLPFRATIHDEEKAANRQKASYFLAKLQCQTLHHRCKPNCRSDVAGDLKVCHHWTDGCKKDSCAIFQRRSDAWLCSLAKK